MSAQNPLLPADATRAQGVPDTGSLNAAGPSRTEGNLPPMPSSGSSAPEASAPPASPVSAALPAAVSASEILTRGLDLAREASPAGAV
jgi:hypothetical protein